jgi:hypothetical protein
MVPRAHAPSSASRGDTAAELSINPEYEAYARRQFPNDARQRETIAQALQLMTITEDGKRIADLLSRTNVRLTSAQVGKGFTAQYLPPFHMSNFGESIKATFTSHPWPHEIQIKPRFFDSPYELAGILAHEGAHLELTQQHTKNLPIRIGGALLGATGGIASLATLGMLDMTGSLHRPGMGTLASLAQGAKIVSSSTHEVYAYRIGDRIDRAIFDWSRDYTIAEDGSQRSWADSANRISNDYVQQITSNITGKDVGNTSLLGSAVATLGGLGAGIGINMLLRRKFHMSPTRALLMTYGPGVAAATGAAIVAHGRSGHTHQHLEA